MSVSSNTTPATNAILEELPALIASLSSPSVNLSAVGTALALLLESLIGKQSHTRSKASGAKTKVVEPERAPEGEAPPAEDYRLTEIDHSKCVGRKFDTKDSDKRWSKPLYREKQCGQACFKEYDLCGKCLQKKTDGKKTWNGVVTEEPIDTCHMYDTQWFIDNKVYWRGWIPEKKEKGSGSGASVVDTATVMTSAVTEAEADAEAEEEQLFPESEVRAFLVAALLKQADIKTSTVIKDAIKHLDATLGGAHDVFKEELKALVEVVRAECAAEAEAEAAAAVAAAAAVKTVKKPKPAVKAK